MLNEYMKFREAATSGEFASLMREDYEDILLGSFADVPKPLLDLCVQVSSEKEAETYRGLKHLQDVDQLIPEGGEYPEIMLGEKDTVTITNRKYGGIIAVTDEMIRYAKLGEIKRLPNLLGESLGRKVEKGIVSVIETTANTTASSGTLTLTRANLETVMNNYKIQTATAADGTTVKLGLIPDTLLVPPALEYDARRILNAVLIPGSANNDPNVIQGALKIVVSHYLTSTSTWYVLKSKCASGLIFQKVVGPPPELSTQEVSSTQAPDGSFLYDKIKYKARMVIGAGVIDAKWAIRSTA